MDHAEELVSLGVPAAVPLILRPLASASTEGFDQHRVTGRQPKWSSRDTQY